MIDRYALISRHNPVYSSLNKRAPLSLGNGRFCFTADFTGLQTFHDEYTAADDAFPLCTMAEWGWHSYPPLPDEEAGLRLTAYNTYGRKVYYATDDKWQEDRFRYIRQRAHKFHLGRIGFEFAESDITMRNCNPVNQCLSLWEGILLSEFTVNDVSVKTETFVHPGEDTLFVRVVSPLLKEKKLNITIVFPYGSHKKTGGDFHVPWRHSSKFEGCSGAFQCDPLSKSSLKIEREMDSDCYHVTVNGNGFSTACREEFHTVVLYPESETIEFSVRFEPVRIPHFDSIGGIPAACSGAAADSFDAALKKCKKFWEHYWNSGGMMDFSGSSDKRAAELERRLVLSQYLIAIQSRGKLPPAETGHTCNSWYGKFHLEMHYWHHAQFALWNRTGELKRSLDYYKKILPLAREIAASQGYSGARWPKMCDPSGENTPSSVAVLLIWQQPHPIMLAELCWRAEPDDHFLHEYRDIIVETAEFMKSFVHHEEDGSYVLGPPYMPAQERHDPIDVLNAAYELEYFRWGFKKADEWLERLGETGNYGEIADRLQSPALSGGVYLAHENCPDTFTQLPYYTDHPSMLAMYGILDSEKINTDCMSATLDKVLAVWDKKTLYGWDFPMMAMTACRLGRYADAVDILLMDSPKNTYMSNGHNRMEGDNALPLYLPGNGGLLIAAAMMAAGYGDKKGQSFPAGFTVKTEGINAYI